MKTKYELNDEVVDENEDYRYRPLWGSWGNPFMNRWSAGYGYPRYPYPGISPAYYPRRRSWGRRRYRPGYW